MILNQPTLSHLELARESFREAFGREPTVAAMAPGRVNLIGEHVDYNDGFVLPMAIDRYVLMVGDRNSKGQINLVSRDMQDRVSGPAETQLSDDEIDAFFQSRPGWARYPWGVIEQVRREGWTVPGFDGLITSTVPLGGGLSSSAALEVATATLLEQLTENQLSLTDKALLCQRAEHRFAGVPCGIMDQFSSVFGEKDQFLLIDCRDQSVQTVPFDRTDVSVLIVNSNVQHSLEDGGYRKRREQCQQALNALGASSFRDVSLQQIDSLRAVDDILFRRARHVVSEIQRTQDVARWIELDELDPVGEAMYESHRSLQQDFEVSCEEIDQLIEIAQGIGRSGGMIGSRITGGGFGGCTVSLVMTEQLESIVEQLDAEYFRCTGRQASLFATRPAAGARGLNL